MFNKLENIKPLRNRILIRLYPIPKEISVNGVIRPVDASIQKRYRAADVLGVGDGVIGIEKGMKVVIDRQFGARLHNPGMFDPEYRIMAPDQIEGVLDDDVDPVDFWINS